MLNQDQLDAVLRPSPILGSTGSADLDLFISSAEQTFLHCQTEVRQRKPLFRKGLDVTELMSECNSLIVAGKFQSDRFMAMAEAELNQKEARARNALAGAIADLKPANILDEQVEARIQSLTLLFDSLDVKKLLPRIEEELEGDSVSRYVCRDGMTGWIRYYLESRNINLQDYYAMLGKTAGVLENGLQKAVEDMKPLQGWEFQVNEMSASLKSAWDGLVLEVVDYSPTTKLNVNSSDLEDSHIITMADLKKFATSGAFGLSRSKACRCR